MAHAEVHVFGSVSGYGTVAASRGLRDDERRELESFQFGEAATKESIQALARRAVMTGRPLRSGRYAVSRMIPAGVDDAGRPTIEIVSLVMDPSAFESCAGNLDGLAADVAFWRAARDMAASGVNMPSAAAQGVPTDPSAQRVFDLWMSAVRAGAVGVLPESEASSVLLFVRTLDPQDRARCRWGIGIMSLSAPVDVCALASGTSTVGARAVIRATPAGAFHLARELEYVAFRAPHSGVSFPSVDEVNQSSRELVLEDDASVSVGVSAQRSRVASAPPRVARRPLSPIAWASIGSAVLSTVVLLVSLTAHFASAPERTVAAQPNMGEGGQTGTSPPQKEEAQPSSPADWMQAERPSGLPSPAAGETPAVQPAGGGEPEGSGGETEQPLAPPSPPPAPVDPCESRKGEYRTLYIDSDRDGDGAGDAVRACVMPNKESMPSGSTAGQTLLCVAPDGKKFVAADGAHYSETNSDECPDNDQLQTQPTFYEDKDTDGAGDPAITKRACSKPAGYVDNADDECPQDNKLIQKKTFYRDEDGDGYGGVADDSACTPPKGYVEDNTDPNDEDNQVPRKQLGARGVGRPGAGAGGSGATDEMEQRAWIKKKLDELQTIQAQCKSIKSRVTAIQPTNAKNPLPIGDYLRAMTAELVKLKEQKDLLTKLHYDELDRQGERLAKDQNRRFSAGLLPGCTKCAYNDELVPVWKVILLELRAICASIGSARDWYSQKQQDTKASFEKALKGKDVDLGDLLKMEKLDDETRALDKPSLGQGK